MGTVAGTGGDPGLSLSGISCGLLLGGGSIGGGVSTLKLPVRLSIDGCVCWNDRFSIGGLRRSGGAVLCRKSSGPLSSFRDKAELALLWAVFGLKPLGERSRLNPDGWFARRSSTIDAPDPVPSRDDPSSDL